MIRKLLPLAALPFTCLALGAEERTDILNERSALYFEIEFRVLYGWEWGSMGAGETDDIGRAKRRPTVPVDDHPRTGESLDSREDLDLGHAGVCYEGSISAYLGKSDRVSIHALQITFRSEATLRRDFTYNDDVFQTGDHVTSQIDILFAGSDYQHRFDAPLSTDLWAGIGFERITSNAGMPDAPGPAGGAMEDTQAWMPYLHLSTATPIGRFFSVQMNARGAAFSICEFWKSENRLILGNEFANSRYIEGDLAFRFQPVHFVSVEAGVEALWLTQHYKGMEEDRDFGNNRLHFRMVAFFVGLRVAF